MKQLVILSGKGGTGKTSVTAALAHLAAQGPLANRLLLADTDVDAANLELVLQPERRERHDFIGGAVAWINPDLCANCGDCLELCRFEAIVETLDGYAIDTRACEGCAACVYQCPAGAIELRDERNGESLRSASRYGPLCHAHLDAGADNSGKLVTRVRELAREQAEREGRERILIDGPPGIGCPVIAAVTGVDLALVVTEPSLSGQHDLQRALDTLDHFGIPALICINKADLYAQGASAIEQLCRERGLELIGRIPFDAEVTHAMVRGEAVTALAPHSPASQAIQSVWSELAKRL